MLTIKFLMFSGFLFFTVQSQSEPTVETTLGKIKGLAMFSSSGRPFFAFRGVPYGKPPTGSLRLKDPVPADPWEGTLDATHEASKCLQYDYYFHQKIVGTEDCLVLNVYTQDLSPLEGLRPVMVWIHGGGFFTGSGNGETDFYGPDYLMDKDIVLVTINYRLGTFGFFSTGTKEAPGNYGLLDQNLALRWVQEHIHNFGGNPDSVTIFGESAGGASVHYHILSPLSKGLFHRAIVQSGTSLCPWAFSESVTMHSTEIAKNVGCPLNGDLIECMSTKKAEDLLLVFPKDDMVAMVFGPRVDIERQNSFLPAYPRELMKKGNYNHVPLIIGVTANEGIYFIGGSGILTLEVKKQHFQENTLEVLRYLLTIPDHPDAKAIAQQALDMYLSKDRPFAQQINELEKMVSDFTFFKCIDDVVHLQKSHELEPIYYYMDSYRSEFSFSSLSGTFDDYGVAHADDLLMLFTNKLIPPLTTVEDKQMSKVFVDLWTSFAIQGEPKTSAFADWKPIKQGGTRYLNISTNLQMINEEMPFYNRLAFWDQIVDPLNRKDEL